ncbi:peptidylprolyl isomerase [Paracoccus sp. p4-l81]|uniref:peptidylprolyl isomerase n=1 Tax=Paracoccus sp. p4-l81 TaxID=3342806 RepID=UPI0035B906BE
MAMKTRFWLAGATAMMLALPAQAEVTGETVVATVNGEQITLAQMIAVREGLQEQFGQMPPQELYDAILDQMVRQVALSQVGDGEKTKRDEVALVLDRRAYLAGAVLERAARVEVPEEQLKAAYDKQFASAEPKQEFNAAHILVETEDEAKAIKAEIDGGKDFGEIAKEKSTGPSGPNSGDLGWFTLDMMVQPFADAVSKLEAGKVSDPVQTQFGWHVIRLNEVRNAAVPSFDEVKDQLAAQAQSQAMEAKMTEVMEAAKVEKPAEAIDPALLTKTELLDQ